MVDGGWWDGGSGHNTMALSGKEQAALASKASRWKDACWRCFGVCRRVVG